jgi:sec-independent protein translocase protein TatA
MIGPQDILLWGALGFILFGSKKLPEMARSLGTSIVEFKKVVNQLDEPAQQQAAVAPAAPAAPAAVAPAAVAAAPAAVAAAPAVVPDPAVLPITPHTPPATTPPSA